MVVVPKRTIKEPMVNIRNLSCQGGEQSMDVVTDRPVKFVGHVSFAFGFVLIPCDDHFNK